MALVSRERARRHLDALAEAKVSDLVPAHPDDLAKGAQVEFAQVLFQMATSPGSVQNFNALSRAFHRLEVAAHHTQLAQIAAQP